MSRQIFKREIHRPASPPSPMMGEEDVIHTLNNILEYTEGKKGHDIVLLHAINSFYAKGVSSKKGEFYYVFRETTRERNRTVEPYLQVSSVVRRKDRSRPPVWDVYGNPVSNVDTVDTMRDSSGAEWVQGFFVRDVKHLFTTPLVEPVKPPSAATLRRRILR